MAKPCPYAKRWWSTDLSELRKEYTRARNVARRQRRYGSPNRELEQEANTTKLAYFKLIRHQKRQHWESFLDNADNIWQAARYLDSGKGATFSPIPAMVNNEGALVQDDNKISEALLTSFFPSPPPYPSPASGKTACQLPMAPVTDNEIQKAIMGASPLKAPGYDQLPAMAWQQLWPVIGQHISQLFRSCLSVGRIPERWKIAKIVPLRKADKEDYTVPGAYRPISLLCTLSKAFEALIATRIAYLADLHGLLPHNHFGALKGKSTVDALLTVQEKIYEAWRSQKVLSLVTFDMKGAFSGVTIDVLINKLRKAHIPEALVKVIHDFCTLRKASVVVNGSTTRLFNLQHAGLPQGSCCAIMV